MQIDTVSSVPQADVQFTAIIPVYNGASFIADAVQSVQQQTHPVAAIIVVDDCSTDNTVDIVSEMAQTDGRILVLCNEVNSGPAYSRNRAIAECSTAFVAFLDADDLWLPEHLAHAAEAIRNYPAASVVYSSLLDDRESHLAESESSGILERPLRCLLEYNSVPQSAAVVRVADIARVGGYTLAARYAEDYELWMRIAAANGQFAEIRAKTFLYKEHPDQVSSRFPAAMFNGAWAARRCVVEEQFGTIAQADVDIVAGLQRARADDLDEALHSRSREVVQLVLALTEWVPRKGQVKERAEILLGWRWPIWRTAAFVYDSMPMRARTWLRKYRV